MRAIKTSYPQVKTITPDEAKGLIERARSNTLTAEDCDTIKAMTETIEFIISLLKKKDVQLKRLLKQILGISEKSRNLFESEKSSDQNEHKPCDAPGEPDGDNSQNSPDGSDNEPPPKKKNKKKRQGHGRNGHESYTGAERIFIAHPTLKSGDACLQCPKGKVYREKKPGIFINIEGRPPVLATIYELEKLRCNLCGAIYQAPLPESIADKAVSAPKHYDETAKSMIVLLRYGYGMPLNRLESLQADLGIPLPKATAWDKSEEVANLIYPVFEELKQQGSQGDLIHNDDTGMKIIETMQVIDQRIKDANGKKVRTGIFTTGIISIRGDRKIALFFTGEKHAGENFHDLLENRDANLTPPLQMCDAKKGNAKDTDSIVCHCNTHARRYFAELSENYPDQCAYVILNVYKEIYKNDALTKNMSMEERLKYHQDKSEPIMTAFHNWLTQQLDEKKAEPNSDLGKAILYVLNHWQELTQFLRIPGAPLDNNICEQGLKMAIRHRRNSLFYKTVHGAYIGDMFMSLIHTCHFAGANPFDYLTMLQKQSSEVFKHPDRFMPWNYKDAIDKRVSLNSESASKAA
jgi:hypothetical protein